ncbi:hypothetical protein BpHYR1_050975 [Brachionus plicatilis]|uniref:Uncharacterized protein n=1 Tax=Brachionus plicatilis TaxID=10195 RepID=A0A3M7QXF8_BRAPC|nr:hypothetical protein BpHYR1_050975 [Brachionus plicatilis]
MLNQFLMGLPSPHKQKTRKRKNNDNSLNDAGPILYENPTNLLINLKRSSKISWKLVFLKIFKKKRQIFPNCFNQSILDMGKNTLLKYRKFDTYIEFHLICLPAWSSLYHQDCTI